MLSRSGRNVLIDPPEIEAWATGARRILMQLRLQMENPTSVQWAEAFASVSQLLTETLDMLLAASAALVEEGRQRRRYYAKIRSVSANLRIISERLRDIESSRRRGPP